MTKCCDAHLGYGVRSSTSQDEISVKVTPLKFTRGANEELECGFCGAPAEYILG